MKFYLVGALLIVLRRRRTDRERLPTGASCLRRQQRRLIKAFAADQPTDRPSFLRPVQAALKPPLRRATSPAADERSRPSALSLARRLGWCLGFVVRRLVVSREAVLVLVWSPYKPSVDGAGGCDAESRQPAKMGPGGTRRLIGPRRHDHVFVSKNKEAVVAMVAGGLFSRIRVFVVISTDSNCGVLGMCFPLTLKTRLTLSPSLSNIFKIPQNFR